MALEWPFEAISGHQKRQKRVRSINVIQFQPSDNPPGLKNMEKHGKLYWGVLSATKKKYIFIRGGPDQVQDSFKMPLKWVMGASRSP